MTSGIEHFTFVPPTSAEVSQDPYAHLRIEFSDGERRFDKGPLEVFGEIGKELVTVADITPEDIVMMLQQETGHSLNTQGIRNLLGWAAEEMIRYQDSEKLDRMSKSERISYLYGVEIDFEDPKEKATRSAA